MVSIPWSVGCTSPSIVRRLTGAELGNEVHDLAQAEEIKQWWRVRDPIHVRLRRIIRPAGRDGTVKAIGELNDEIGIRATPHADDRDQLAV